MTQPTYPSPDEVLVAVDLVVLTVVADELSVLLVERGIDPFVGQKALPGGFVLPGETLEEAALRELEEETGVRPQAVHLEQLASYGDPDRDPRQRVVSIAYLALVERLPEVVGGSDAAEAGVEPVNPYIRSRRPKTLAFDHRQILIDGVERARAKLEYTTLATKLLAEPFTIGELRAVYEAVWGMSIDPRNFHRKVQATEGFVEELDERTTRGGGRPALLHRAGAAQVLSPPLVR